MKIPQVWRVLQVLRENPDGVTSEFLIKNHVSLYHKFGSRTADLRNHYGYNIPKAERAGDLEWNYRWILLNPEYHHPEEAKFTGNPGDKELIPAIPVKPYFDKRTGQGELATWGPF